MLDVVYLVLTFFIHEAVTKSNSNDPLSLIIAEEEAQNKKIA